MAKKLDADHIEQERQKKKKVSRKDEARRKMKAELDRNQGGERK